MREAASDWPTTDLGWESNSGWILRGLRWTLATVEADLIPRHRGVLVSSCPLDLIWSLRTGQILSPFRSDCVKDILPKTNGHHRMARIKKKVAS